VQFVDFLYQMNIKIGCHMVNPHCFKLIYKNARLGESPENC
jgi:hypothetical protein